VTETGAILERMRVAALERPRFSPPFCPWPECVFHTASDLSAWRFHRRGARRVQRSAHPNPR
jgi:hypothetical protein